MTKPPLWSSIRWGILAGSRCHRVAITEVQAVPKHSLRASIWWEYFDRERMPYGISKRSVTPVSSHPLFPQTWWGVFWWRSWKWQMGGDISVQTRCPASRIDMPTRGHACGIGANMGPYLWYMVIGEMWYFSTDKLVVYPVLVPKRWPVCDIMMPWRS